MPFLSGRPAIFHVFLGSGISSPHLGHLAMPFPPAMKYIRPLTTFILIFPLFIRSYSRAVKSAMAKVDIFVISGVLNSVW